jgi:hypothetical protein
MINRDRRKVVANIFADFAKYVLTAGIIGSLVAEKLPILSGLGMLILFIGLTLITYFVTPKDVE